MKNIILLFAVIISLVALYFVYDGAGQQKQADATKAELLSIYNEGVYSSCLVLPQDSVSSVYIVDACLTKHYHRGDKLKLPQSHYSGMDGVYILKLSEKSKYKMDADSVYHVDANYDCKWSISPRQMNPDFFAFLSVFEVVAPERCKALFPEGFKTPAHH